ncbi:MAG: GNAT family N-acetyltransferase [Defluviitaleaceae bacterium]|nr:GNAT family N-acetyltransferase [Defluviitaleaceae bacterium]
MTIRDMEIYDLDFLSELYFQFWGEKSNVVKVRKKFSQLQENPAYILLCAVEDDRLVGSVMGVICEELYGECQPFLVVENMIVDSSCRKKGIGKLLFAELEKQAKKRECSQILLVTESNREDACGFYESLGFHPTANKGYKKKI